MSVECKVIFIILYVVIHNLFHIACNKITH